MEKIKNFLLSTNFAVTVLVLIGLRIVVAGASVGDALALSAVCALQGFYRWLDSKKPEPINDAVLAELNGMNTQIKEIQDKVAGVVMKNSIRTPVNPDVNQGLKRFF